jgi:hypothetical protein
MRDGLEIEVRAPGAGPWRSVDAFHAEQDERRRTRSVIAARLRELRRDLREAKVHAPRCVEETRSRIAEMRTLARSLYRRPV